MLRNLRIGKLEIAQYKQWYSIAASNAIHKAGFDGVEIHAAGGNLIDQFLQDISNKRTDEYGGSISNRAQFLLDVVDAVVQSVGASRVAIKLGPWSEFNGTSSQFSIETQDSPE